MLPRMIESFLPPQKQRFLVRIFCCTSHPHYQRVKVWAKHYGEVNLEEEAFTPAEAKMQAIRKVVRAGANGCMLGRYMTESI